MKLTVILISSLVLVACQSKLDKQIQKEVDNINTLKAAIAADTGNDIQFKKISGSGTETYIVYKNNTTGEYMAYNLSKWDGQTMTTLSQYVADSNDIVHNLDLKQEWVTTGHTEDDYDYRWITTSNWDATCSCNQNHSSYDYVKIGSHYVDDSGYYPFYYGGGFRFENEGGASKDLETLAALREEKSVDNLSKTFKNQYSLSNDRAQELAKLSYKYMRVENARELTTTEKDKFALKSLGVSMNDIENAMKKKAEGSEADYQNLLQKAAQVNNTTPEMIGKFFDQMGDTL
jgi:hypothetical protein